MPKESTQSIEDLTHQIVELETKVTFQDHLIEELNQALIEQQGDLKKLARIVENIVSQVEQIGDGNQTGNGVELPPHY
ncbi:MAG: SlyX family protein [Kangiellaceae bacterium]|nr:SlyX family protein [Kangiellaceae bacterium]